MDRFDRPCGSSPKPLSEVDQPCFRAVRRSREARERHTKGTDDREELAEQIRFVLIPGMNDTPENVGPLADFVATLGNVARVDILPFHTLGSAKYDAIGLPFPLADRPAPTAEQVEAVRGVFRARGLVVT